MSDLSDRITDDGHWMSPSIEVDDGAIILHYGNTRIRNFGEPFKHMVHVEYRDEEGQLKGLRCAAALLQLLVEKEFPSQYDYFPNQQDVDWWADVEMLDANLIDIDGLPPEFDGMM